jgi:Na+/H+-dicarboxylate symporter
MDFWEPFQKFTEVVSGDSLTAQATLQKLLDAMGGIVYTAIGAVMVLATIAFLWGIIQYVTASGDEQKLSDSKKYIVWGLIAMLLIVAMWGIVFAVYRTFFT